MMEDGFPGAATHNLLFKASLNLIAGSWEGLSGNVSCFKHHL